MKAIDKERDRRYQSTSSFADDIRRYLDHETVLACPPSAGYRFQKFARRNRGVLAAAAAVLAALLLGLAGTNWSRIQALQAEERAEADLRRANEEISKMVVFTRVKDFLAGQSRRFEGSTCDVLDKLTGQIKRDPHLSGPELQPWQHELLEEVIRFWDQTISTEVDSSGKPGRRTAYYRLQRALCLARSGDLERAFSETQVVRNDPDRTDDWANDLFRVCAICAAASQSDPALADSYVEEALKFMKEAAELGEIAPPSPNDPELAALASHKDFPAILKDWLDNWKKKESQTAKK